MDRLERLISGARPTLRRLGELVVRSAKEFGHDRCTSFAAAMSYYVLFSLFPLLLLAVAVTSFFVSDSDATEELVREISQVIVISDEGKQDLENQLSRALDGVGAVGLVGLVGLVWSSSAMMTALRAGLDVAWDVERRRPFVLGKLVDLLVVLILSALFFASIVLTIIRPRVDAEFTLHPVLGDIVATLLPIALSFGLFLLAYRLLPAVTTRLRDIWIGALAAALLFEVAKAGLAFYFGNFGNYSIVYGSLGAVISFLFFVWVVSNIVLYGAEMAAEWPRVRSGYYDDLDEGPPTTLRQRIASMLTFRRDENSRLPPPAARKRAGGEP